MIKLKDLTKEHIYSELKNTYKEFEDIEILNNVYFQGPHSYSDAHGIADAQYSGSDVHAVDYYLSKAFTTDLQNGNNNEKLRIINKVSSAIDEIEQIVKQLNSAYRDMLVYLYDDETAS